MFRIKVNKNHSKGITSSGSAIVIEYKKVFSKVVNNRCLVKVGEYNLYDKIQTYADDNNIYKLLDKYNNDFTKLVQVQKSYVDLVNEPSNLSDMSELVSRFSADFDTLPVDLKARFGNNPYNLLDDVKKGRADVIFNDYFKSKFNSSFNNNTDFSKSIVNDDVKKNSKNVDSKEVDNE